MAARERANHGISRNGVPFVALPPEDGRDAESVIILWHGADAPRSEVALMSSLPLRDLAAWRIYLGLPLFGNRSPEGGPDELMRRGAEDAVTLLFHPVIAGAAEELPDAITDILQTLGIDAGLPKGVFGFSIGGSAALVSLARSDVSFQAAVTLGAITDIPLMIDHISSSFGTTYDWTEPRRRLATLVSVKDRAAELSASNASILFAVGSNDPNPILEPTQQLVSEIRDAGGAVELREVDVVGHSFVDEPGVTGVPQVTQARVVEELVFTWFREHLI